MQPTRFLILLAFITCFIILTDSWVEAAPISPRHKAQHLPGKFRQPNTRKKAEAQHLSIPLPAKVDLVPKSKPKSKPKPRKAEPKPKPKTKTRAKAETKPPKSSQSKPNKAKPKPTKTKTKTKTQPQGPMPLSTSTGSSSPSSPSSQPRFSPLLQVPPQAQQPIRYESPSIHNLNLRNPHPRRPCECETINRVGSKNPTPAECVDYCVYRVLRRMERRRLDAEMKVLDRGEALKHELEGGTTASR